MCNGASMHVLCIYYRRVGCVDCAASLLLPAVLSLLCREAGRQIRGFSMHVQASA